MRSESGYTQRKPFGGQDLSKTASTSFCVNDVFLSGVKWFVVMRTNGIFEGSVGSSMLSSFFAASLVPGVLSATFNNVAGSHFPNLRSFRLITLQHVGSRPVNGNVQPLAGLKTAQFLSGPKQLMIALLTVVLPVRGSPRIVNVWKRSANSPSTS